MDFDQAIRAIQQHFTDGLVLVIGSGLSAAEGIPGMPDLAQHLSSAATVLTGEDRRLWESIEEELRAEQGLEAALLKHAPSTSLESWIARLTCELILPAERRVMRSVIAGAHTLRLTTFLSKVLRPATGLPILTTNYDRLIEVACEMAGFHVDTLAVGHYAGQFDPSRSCMSSCRGIVNRGKTHVLDHFPRAVVLKPHGSLDWYKQGEKALRSSADVDLERLIITPGLNKYRAGYRIPFDKHREFANNHINQSARLFVVGYGFNDDHLHTHLLPRIRAGTPTLVLTRTASATAIELAREAPQCICLSKPASSAGVVITSKTFCFEESGRDLWDLGILATELLI